VNKIRCIHVTAPRGIKKDLCVKYILNAEGSVCFFSENFQFIYWIRYFYKLYFVFKKTGNIILLNMIYIMLCSVLLIVTEIRIFTCGMIMFSQPKCRIFCK